LFRYDCRSCCPLRGEQGDGKLYRLLASKSLYVYLNGYQRFIAVRIYFNRREMHALNSGIPLTAEFNRTPDTNGWQARTPIPPIAKLSLAHHDSIGVPSPTLEWRKLHLQ